MVNKDSNWKDAIVFISSTFNDMHAERDYLVKEVFPELTEWCEKRHIRLTDIDLRWGVTEEDSSNNKTIETCLRHVDKSRPFFLCFLGQRRGWVPDYDRDISEETKKLYDFEAIREKGDRSATEMEIEHALLRPFEILKREEITAEESGSCRHSIFFFRDGEYAKEENEFLSKEQRLIYTNEYLKEIDVSKVMGKLKGNDYELGKDPELYESILSRLKEDFTNGEIKYPKFICDLIYDIQDTDCDYYNNLIDDLVENPLKENNLVVIAELKFKNPGIYKDIVHEVKDNDEKLYDDLMSALDDYEYERVGIDEFCDEFKDDVIREIIDEINLKNEEEFEVHERELKNIRTLIEEKQSKANEQNETCPENKRVHVVINDYKGNWNNDLKLQELSHYKFNEGQGKLTDFECNGLPLKKVIINEFKRQFEMEFKDHIQEIVNKNPKIYDGEDSDIIEINPQDIPDEEKKLANELDQQDNFCHNNSEGFVPREYYTNKLKRYVESSENGICLVSAEAGLGKTMLLADFATKFNDHYPEKRLYKRFCGGSDQSSKTYSLWKYIIDEAGLDKNADFYPKNIIDLRRHIDDILREMAKEEDVVIIIDAINQMEDGMEMLNWFGELPENLKLIISVKEINLDKLSSNREEGFEESPEEKLQKEKDKAYQEKLEIIKRKRTISDEFSFSLNELDCKKEENIRAYVNNIKEYLESSDENICLVNSELNYDKSLIFHIFNDKCQDKKIYNVRCNLTRSDCPSDKLKKSVREFAKRSVLSFREITGNADCIKSKLESHLGEIDSDSIILIDLMNNDEKLFEKIAGIDYPSKAVIGIKKYENKEVELADKSEFSFVLEELDPEKNRIIKSYLSNFLKELDEREIHDICNFEGSKNPLFLKILLAELRVFGSFDQLKDEIKSFGDEPLTAFEHVFERLEKDEDDRGDKHEIVKPLFSLLASSRVGGLSEEEIVSIIKDRYGLDEDYVSSNVNLNLRQVRPFMARKESRHDFFYEKFREAAEKKYLDYKQENIGLLRDYFRNEVSKNSESPRAYVELPYYLNESGNIEELEETLSDYSFIKNKLTSSKDVYGLISDYKYLKLEDEEEEDSPLELIQRCLELSSPVLMNYPDELPVQFWGRMKGIEESDSEKYAKIGKLLDDLKGSEEMYLKPTSSVLYSPKSSIIKRLLPDGNKSSSDIVFTDDEKIIFGSSDGVLSLYNVNDNSFEVLEKIDSKIVKFILKEDGSLYVARANGDIKKWNLTTRDVEDLPKIDVGIEDEDAEIRDIYVSDTYGKLYAVSHMGIFTIDLETKELREEDIEHNNYNQILVPRRNEAILVCDEKEVDGWDVYEMRKAYNRQHQQNPDNDEDAGTKMDSSEAIRFMGLNKRFLTLISENGQMKFWNTLKNSGGGESIDEAQVCSPHDKFAQAITLEDEDQIITISDMGVLRVWDIPRPRQPKFEIAKIEGTEIPMDIQTGIKSPTAIDYFTDGDDRWVIIGNENNDISIIDLNKKVEANEETKHSESVLSIKIEGNHMITASDNGEIFTWDLDSEECINKFANDFRVNSISYNSDKSQLAMAGVKTEKDGRKTYKIATKDTSDMWIPIKLKEDNVAEGEDGDKNKSKEIPDLNAVDEVNENQVIDIAQTSSGIVFLEEKKLSINGNLTDLDKSATTLATKFDSNDAFVGFEDGSIVEYPDGTDFNAGINCPVKKIRVSVDKMVAGYGDGSISIFDLSGTKLAGFKAHEKAITNIYLDDYRLISLSEDNTIKFWNNDECVYTYFLDIFATSINIKDGKLILGDTLGNLRFFEFNDFYKDV